jgi:hypothetical protein
VVKRPSRWLFRVRWVVCLAGMLCGCTRKAPGPAECQALSLALVGVDAETAAMMLRVRHAVDIGVDAETAAMMLRVQHAVDIFTVDCLTTPYDRQLLQCMAQQTTVLPRRAAQSLVRCLLIPNEAHMSYCIRQRGPGQACLAEFQLRHAEESAPSDSGPSEGSRWIISP